MDLAHRTLALALTFIFSVVGFAYFTAHLRDFACPAPVGTSYDKRFAV